MPEFVTEDELQRMVTAATLGQEHQPSSPYAREVWERIQRQVAEIKAKGRIVDASAGLP